MQTGLLIPLGASTTLNAISALPHGNDMTVLRIV
jgi:hypothetical protein